jgi:porin
MDSRIANAAPAEDRPPPGSAIGLRPDDRLAAQDLAAGSAPILPAADAAPSSPPLRRCKPWLGALALLAAGAAPPAMARAEAPSGLPDFAGETLTGDWGGRRTALAARGLDIGLDYTAEVLGNLRGGARRGTAYHGLLGLGVTLDLQRMAGWRGGRLHVSALQIHGRGLSEHYLGNLLTTSGIEAVPSTRLYEAWFEQEMFGGFAALRLGQILADEEFLVSESAGIFVNATFGWPGITAVNLPGGGPAYPLATPGVRLRLGAPQGTSVAIGAFNGDPAGGRAGDPQRANRHGLLFPLGDDAFLIAELAHAARRGPAGLPATFKLGAWYHTGQFEDLRATAEEAVTRRGNFGAYAVADALLWRPGGQESGGLGAFLRVAAAPSGRNPIDFYLDGGLTWTGLLPGRPDDVLGLGVAYAQVSGPARRRDREARLLDDLSGGLRRQEALVELTYAAQVRPGWLVQPTAQFVVNPGAEAEARNALIVGLRVALSF